MTIEDLLVRLECPRPRGSGRWVARCPAHTDKTPSLSVSEGERGILLRCWAGCAIEEITKAMGLQVRDLFFDANLDPVALHRARAQHQAQKRQEQAESHVVDLEIDSRREAQRFLERARNFDISNWTDTQLNRAWDDLAAAHHRLQAEGTDHYYEFILQL